MWDLVFVRYVDFNRNWLRSVGRHVAFPCTFSTCPCWICMWSMCLLILRVNNLLERMWLLCRPNDMFIFLWNSFSGDLFWRCTHRGRLQQNKLSNLFSDMHLHVVTSILELSLQCVKKIYQVECCWKLGKIMHFVMSFDCSDYIIRNVNTHLRLYNLKHLKHPKIMHTKYVCMGLKCNFFRLYNLKFI